MRPLITITLAPLNEQRRIVAKLEKLLHKVTICKKRLDKNLSTQSGSFLDRLTQSILAKAFRGELVPQDPNDEPASVLLERIKEEGNKQQAEMKNKKKDRRRTKN